MKNIDKNERPDFKRDYCWFDSPQTENRINKSLAFPYPPRKLRHTRQDKKYTAIKEKKTIRRRYMQILFIHVNSV